MPGEHHHGTPLPATARQHSDERPSGTPQSWSFALFALLTTAAIIAVALAAPLVFDRLASHVRDFFGISQGVTDHPSSHGAIYSVFR